MRIALTLIILCLFVQQMNAQEAENERNEGSEEFKRHQIGLVVAHSHVSHGVVADGKKWEVLPSWGLFYNYKFSEKWGIGLHIDMIVENFEVERHLSSGESDEILLREKPIAPAIMGIFHPTEHSSFTLGFGLEYASDETFALTRIGYEWSTPISDKWELVIPLTYDLRWDAYDVWMLGIGVSRVF